MNVVFEDGVLSQSVYLINRDKYRASEQRIVELIYKFFLSIAPIYRDIPDSITVTHLSFIRNWTGGYDRMDIELRYEYQQQDFWNFIRNRKKKLFHTKESFFGGYSQSFYFMNNKLIFNGHSVE